MKIELIGKPETVMSNPDSKHNYFGWPTAVTLPDGRIAVGASGFRLEHICPFGKAVISYSYDGGKTYTRPAPVIDTPLDDRDTGICVFGNNSLIVTSFNNSADMQRHHNTKNRYVQNYINTIAKEDEEKYLGATFRISRDGGITFGEIHRSPITSPHGPVELRDGTVLWAGTRFEDIFAGIEVHRLDTETCKTELIGRIPCPNKNVVLNEPHLIELPDGRLICHIRGENSELFDGGKVSVNGKAVKKNYKCVSGDVIEFSPPEVEDTELTPQDIPLDIVFEDGDVIVINKPRGMVVHPAAGNEDGTMVNALLYHCGDSLSGINGVIRPGIVHRIDKNTSGLLIVAKNDKAHLHLAEQIKAHSFTREYEAIVSGSLKQESGTVDAPIGRHKTDRKKMCVTAENSRNAVTHYSLIRQFGGYAHIKCRLETGRTHQIRVHMAYIGNAVLGDDVYGKAYKGIEGQCLHARKIGFIHPTTEEYLEFSSDLPDYFTAILNKLEKQ